MTGILRTGWNWTRDIMLPPTTVGLKGILVNTFFYNILFNVLLNGTGQSETRLATLCLKGRLSEQTKTFTTWVKTLYPQDFVRQAETRPIYTLLWAERNDFARKIVASTIFYMTQNPSLYVGCSKLLARSTKASNIAQPILDKMASVPIPRFLPIHVIAFAPVILKLIHLCLIYIHPLGKTTTERDPLEILKTVVDKSSKGLEFLWNLRFALNSLVHSTTVGRSFISVVGFSFCNLPPISRYVKNKGGGYIRSFGETRENAMQGLQPWSDVFKAGVPMFSFALAANLPFVYMILARCDLCFTIRSARGVDYMQANWQTFSTPWDDQVLEQLYTNKASVAEIDCAQQKGQIQEFFALKLKELLHPSVSAPATPSDAQD